METKSKPLFSMLISPHFTRNYAPTSSSSFSFLSLGPPCLSLTADETFSFLISPCRFKRQPQCLDLALLFTKDYLIIFIPKWELKQNSLSFFFVVVGFFMLLRCSGVNWNSMSMRWGTTAWAQMFWGDVRPLSPSHTPLPLGLRAVVAHIYFISLMWVTPAWWWPLVSRSQIAVSEAYLWHDLWAGVTTDSQDCHCPATALNSRRRGALSALRQTRLPSLKRIKLFHHVGNEKAVITPN